MKPLIFLTLLTLSTQSLSSEITIGFEEWPPYQYTRNGKVLGNDVEKVRKAFNKLKLKPKFLSSSWTRALNNVETGKSDAIFSLKKNAERERYILYPKTPLSFQKTVLFARRDHEFSIKELEDLKGLTIERVRGNIFNKEFDEYNGYLTSYSTSQEMMFKKLAAGRSDLAVANEAVALEIIKKLNLQGKLVPIDFVIKNIPLYIGFSKIKFDQEFIDKLDEVL